MKNIQTLTKDFLKTRVAGAAEVVLKPPMENSQLLMSIESFSVIDLLAEGPVGGLVDKNGAYVDRDKLLCGLYIDQVPVRETISQASYSNTVFPQYVSAAQPLASDFTGLTSALTGYDEQFRTVLSDNSETALDLDKFLASNANQLNYQLVDLLSQASTLDPFLLRGATRFFGSNDVRYAFLSYSGIDASSLNLSNNNTSVRLMWSGTDGSTGLLANRSRKNSNNSGQFNQMVVSQIPDPIYNLAYKTTSSENNDVSDINGGYIMVPLASGDVLGESGGKVVFSSVDSECIDFTSDNLSGASLFLQSVREDTTATYNYDKIQLEIRNGTEDQGPLTSIPLTSRAYDTSFQLAGPITDASYSDTFDASKMALLTPASAGDAYSAEGGSIKEYDFAAWSASSFGGYNDDKATYTHMIENEAVKNLSITYTLSSLYDTIVTDENEKAPAGTQTVALVEMGIEMGLEGDIDENDPLYETLQQYHQTISFGIEGMVSSSAFRFRIGGGSNNNTTWLNATNGSSNLSELVLPPEMHNRKRYVKIYRKTPETFSSKRNISISLSSINEYYGKNFSYPLSSVAGVKIDSRAFSRVPSRAYDMRLKKVLVPSNYYPLNPNGTDKRFIKNKNTVDDSNKAQIYRGDWDGTFRYDWTDNPAWITYDLLVDPVYALGNQMDDLRDINVWQLYEISKFCDSVDDAGEFVGVDDGRGGLEPRFSCNIMFNNESEAFDVLNSIATIFRGTVFYAGSDVDFYYDSEQEEVAMFTNANVEGGEFSYSDSLKSSRYTVVEVPYVDKDDNFLQKIEYYEDEESIQRYGYIKYTFQGIGTTSRGQAQRFAKYALFTNKLETETVSFTAGREALLLQPSDIIRIDDEIKNIQSVGAYVAEVDYVNKRVIIPFVNTGEFDTGIWLYCITGENSLDQLFQEAYENENSISQTQINKLNTPKIKNFGVSSYGLTGSSDGGTGIVINLNTGQSGIERMSDVQVGSFCSIQTTGRDDNLYKIISMSEAASDKFDISAAQYEPRKFALIESGIRFSAEEDYFSNLSVSYNDNTPDPPSALSITGAVSIVGNEGGVRVTGDITENTSYPLTSQYECILTTPRGKKFSKKVDNSSTVTQVVFGPYNELGTYKMDAYSHSSQPLELRSVNPAANSFTVTPLSSSVYNFIALNSIELDKAVGSFPASNTSSSATGSYESYQGPIGLNWSVKDRLGKIISRQDDMIDHWDNPRVSLDLLYNNGDLLTENVFEKITKTRVVISQEELESQFNGDVPRNYKIRLRVTGDSQSTESTGVLNIANPEPTLSRWKISSAYDSIANKFRVWGDAPLRYREDISEICLYTGSSGEFSGSDANLMVKINVGQASASSDKSLKILGSSFYPSISDNTMVSLDSVTDSLFINGEKCILQSPTTPAQFPTSLSGNTIYEFVHGKTHNSIFYIDGDHDYAGTSSGVYNQSYLTGTGLLDKNAAYYPFERQLGVTTHTSDNTGLLSGLNGVWPSIEESENGPRIYNPAYIGSGANTWTNSTFTGFVWNDIGYSGSWTGYWGYSYGDGWISVADSTYAFSSAAESTRSNIKTLNLGNRGASIRLAVDRTATKVDPAVFQQNLYGFSVCSWVLPASTSGKQYLFDMGGETGGWSFQLSGNQTAQEPSGSYRLDMRLCNTAGLGSSGELITVTGGANVWELGKWFHMGITYETLSGGAADFTGLATVYINGQPHNSGSGIGSGINNHWRACGIGTQMGNSTTGAGNDGLDATYLVGNPATVKLTELGYFTEVLSANEMAQQYYNIRNQYAVRFSTGGYLVQGIDGNNQINPTYLKSLENTILKVDVGNPSGPEGGQESLIEKIRSSTQMGGLMKQFTLQSQASISNDNFVDLVNSTFYLEEVDYLSNNLEWKKIGDEDFKMRFIKSGASNSYRYGRWIIYSGVTGNAIYQYTGVANANPGLIATGSDAEASGKVPIGATFKTGAYGNTQGYPASPLPYVTNKTLDGNNRIKFADFFTRMRLTDYLGQAATYIPDNRDKSLRVNFAERTEVGTDVLAKNSLAVGEQLQYVIDRMAEGVTWTDTVIEAEVGDAIDEPLPDEGADSSTRTVAPVITSEQNITIGINDPYEAMITATCSDPTANIYISNIKSEVETAFPSITEGNRIISFTQPSSAVYCTAKADGYAVSATVSVLINFYLNDGTEDF
jgi:hypothetical protein